MVNEFRNSNNLILKYYDNDLTINWSDSIILDSSKYAFAFKLEGFDRDWVKCGTDIKTRYTNLSAGQYRFRLKWSCDGKWNEEGVYFDLIITPAWWRTFYFRIIMMVIIFFTIINNFVLRLKLRNTDDF